MKYLTLFLVGLFTSLLSLPSVSAQVDPLSNIVKLKTYQYDRLSESFVFKSYGSAVAIGPRRIITNAHVILDSDGYLPTGYYEVCISQKMEQPPLCRDTARLIAYDIVADLALLEMDSYTFSNPIPLDTATKLKLGSEVIIYGYPSIGGDTITRTQWKIAGYSAGMYKIDGTIDHGDSGGGAFDHSWTLIGIPTAVASDNWVIGYMIDRSRILAFLGKRTENYTPFSVPRENRFRKMIQQNQMYTSLRKNIPFLYWTLRLPPTQTFRLVSATSSQKDQLLTLSFRDTYDRTTLLFQCTRDGSSILGWTARQNGLEKESIDYPTWKSTAKHEGDMNQFYVVYDTNRGDTGSKFQDTVYYKNHDACYGQISYNSKVLDANLVKKAHEFLKTGVLFHKSYILNQSQNNSYFFAHNISESVRVVESIWNESQKYVTLSFEVSPGRFISSNISQETYSDISHFFIGTLGLESYDGIYNWENFIVQVRENIQASQLTVFDEWNNRKSFYLVKRDEENKKIRIMFYYPYLTQEDIYGVWYWDHTFPIGEGVDTTMIRNFFESLELPWSSPFNQ